MITSNDRRSREVSMFLVLVLFAGTAISEAGVLKPSVGYGLRYPGASINSGNWRPNPFISHLPPTVLNYGYNSHAIGPVFSTAPISPPIIHGLTGRLPSLNSHISRPALLNPSIINQPFGPQFINAPISLPLVKGLPFGHVPISPLVFNPATNGNFAVQPVQLNSIPLISTPTDTSQNTVAVEHVKVVQQEVPEKSVSYSVSANDYQNLKRHKIEGKDSPYNPVPGFEFATRAEKHKNTHSHEDSDAASNEPSVKNIKRSVLNYNDEFVYNTGNFDVSDPEPQVTKHIYFHVPPPDFEEQPPVQVSLSPKKTYNILFIKAPSQEHQNYAYRQQLLLSRQPQIEDKTLIYVLSKNEQTPHQEALPPTPVSSPEVFFVNYRTGPRDLTDINNEIVDQSLLENISPVFDRKRSADKEISKEN